MRILGVAVACLTIAGCDVEPERERNSGTDWIIGEAPEVDTEVADSNGRSVIQFASAATRLSNGNIVIADLYAAALHIVSPEGVLVRSIGRRGSGPEDFGDIRWVGQCQRDSLYVWDYRLRRVAVLDSSGTWVRSYQPGSAAHEVRCSGTGLMAVMDMPKPPTAAEPQLMSDVWVGSLTGESVNRVGPVPFGEPRVMGKATRFAITRDRLYIATADSAGLSAYTLDRSESTYIHLDLQQQQPNAVNYQAAVEAAASTITNVGVREQFKSQQLAVGPPAFAPYYADMITDSEGLIWLVVSMEGEPTTRLARVASDGAVAEMLLPNGVRLFEIGENYILGRRESDDGAHRVVLYRLTRA